MRRIAIQQGRAEEAEEMLPVGQHRNRQASESLLPLQAERAQEPSRIATGKYQKGIPRTLQVLQGGQQQPWFHKGIRFESTSDQFVEFCGHEFALIPRENDNPKTAAGPPTAAAVSPARSGR
jgi:hypothetical protein